MVKYKVIIPQKGDFMEDLRPLKEIQPALVHLYKFYPSLEVMGKAIGVSASRLSNWRRGDNVSVSKSRWYRVQAIYEKVKDKEPAPEVLAKSLWTRDQRRMEENHRPGAVLKPLEIGKSYVVREESDPRYGHVVKGRVLKDLGHFYLLDCGGYKETVSKNTLMTDACRVKRI